MNSLFGLNPAATDDHVASLASLLADPKSAVQPQVKSYSDSVYFNYYALGFSIMFKPINGYRPSTNLSRGELEERNLILESIDIYNSNVPSQAKSKLTPVYSPYPHYPIVISLVGQTSDGKERANSFPVAPATTGKEFVETIGEPDRKGGGVGPSTGSISIWCEWSKDGIMVEFGGDGAKGPQAWEKGKDAPWKVITLYKP